ncbi:MAG: zinc ribbon domain-containing protein [Planctomycetaceae bacterium]|nr:zinc ribbon domain-containing protein [Planctomycetaceae bacterium]
MPMYEYRCQSCGTEFEELVRAGETPPCPKCAGKKLEKLMSASAGHTGGSLPITGPGCPPSDAPPCGTGCCRLPR